jgi:diguanylate cyclase (GGDEF)-like protein
VGALMKDSKNICYIGADLNAPSSLRKLRMFTSVAASRGYRVAAVWPGFNWQNLNDNWKLYFFKVFSNENLCAAVIDGEFLQEAESLEPLCDIFRKIDIPVITLDAEYPGTTSIVFDDRAALRELLNHMTLVHKCRNLLFVGDSAQKLACDRIKSEFEAFLKEEGITNVDDHVFLSGFRMGEGIFELSHAIEEKKPDAVICSDNNVGNMVTGIIKGLGKEVPSDILVTGLNGISKRRAGVPDLTASKRNLTTQAQNCISLVERFCSKDPGNIENIVLKQEIVYSESCGCNKALDLSDAAELISKLIIQRELASMQERRQGGFIDKLYKSESLEDKRAAFRSILPDLTYLCLRKSFLANPTAALGDLQSGEDFEIFAAPKRELEGKLFNGKTFEERMESQFRNAAPLLIYPISVKEMYFGFVVSEAPEFMELQLMMGRLLIELCKSLSIVVRDVELQNRMDELQDMSEYLNNVQYIDSGTGLLNHNGLVMELENCKETCILRRQTIYAVCVDLDHLGNINDIYGHSEGDFAISKLAGFIKDSASPADLISHIGSDEFIVAIRADEKTKDEVDYFINRLQSRVDAFNTESNKEYTLNINVSTSITVPYPETDIARIIDEALLNKRLTKNNRKAASVDSDEMTTEELKQSETIKDVIDNNRFRYAFQPIVNARTGDIFAYEALMRTGTEQSISPLTIIKYSTANKRLYDIERATFFNVLDVVSSKREKFKGKKIFINSIPGCQLDMADFTQLKQKYSDLFKDVFIEITEQSEQKDDEVRELTQRSVEEGFGIAIDDYGVGYANTTSLLRYTPNCVKIDRLLIQNLQNDPRKQHFVENIIEFAHNNSCYALAEGVETSGEMKASIDLGVDLIQGFYTAKPNFEIVDHIEEQIQNEILEYNSAPTEKRFNKLYVVSREKELMLTRLGLEMYTDILISGQDVILAGNLDYPADVKIRIKENTDSTLTIRNIILDNVVNDVGIDIGENASLTLIVEGENIISSNGIRVPATSTLKIIGNGNLTIKSRCQEAFGIGNDLQHPFGTIMTDISGHLSIELNGEKAVGIGGCVPGPGAKIILKGGDNLIKGSSTAFVGIGSFSGHVDASLTEMHMTVNYNVINGVAIGTPSGISSIRVSNLLLDIKGGGKSITGLGGAARTQNSIEIVSAEVNIDMNAPRVIMIGCALGQAKIYSEHTKITLNGSGGQVLGMGCTDYGGEIVLRSVGVFINISSDTPLPIGAKPENCDFGTSEPEIKVINYSAVPPVWP